MDCNNPEKDIIGHEPTTHPSTKPGFITVTPKTPTIPIRTIKPPLNMNIDKHYCDMVKSFDVARHHDIPRLKRECDILKHSVRESIEKNIREKPERHKLNRYKHDLSPDIITRSSKIARIKEIKTEIAKIESDYRNYMLIASQSVFRFYEEKQQMSTGKNTINTNSVSTFFGITQDTFSESTVIPEPESENDTKTPDPPGNETKNLYQKYWTNVDRHFADASSSAKSIAMYSTGDYILDTTTCISCGTGELIPQEEEGILVCNNITCGKYIAHIIDNQKSTHSEIQTEVYYTAYNRLNHFKEILSQFQAKQTTTIPQHVIDQIAIRMKKERMTKDDICYSQMRHILTVLNLSKYFEHIQHINAIFGVKPPIMDDELHDTLCVLFIEIQTPWSVCCPSNRVNFFNYTY
jgi:hypothetical protein